MRVAIVGGGCAGLRAARVFHEAGVDFQLFEAASSLGGHARTVRCAGYDVDVGFMVFNERTSAQCAGRHVVVSVDPPPPDDELSHSAQCFIALEFLFVHLDTYPTMLQWFSDCGVELEKSDMSFGVEDVASGVLWSSVRGPRSLFATWAAYASPSMWRFAYDLISFKADVEAFMAGVDDDDYLHTGQLNAEKRRSDNGVLHHSASLEPEERLTLGEWMLTKGYGDYFKRFYLIPMVRNSRSCLFCLHSSGVRGEFCCVIPSPLYRPAQCRYQSFVKS